MATPVTSSTLCGDGDDGDGDDGDGDDGDGDDGISNQGREYNDEADDDGKCSDV